VRFIHIGDTMLKTNEAFDSLIDTQD